VTGKRKKKPAAPTAWEAPENFAHLFHTGADRPRAITGAVLSLTAEQASRVRTRAKAPVRGRRKRRIKRP